MHRFFARGVVIADLLGAFLIGVAGLRVGEIGAIAEMIESGFELFVKQRQPMFHALIARAGADGLVKRVVIGHSPEGCGIAAPKARNSFVIQMYLTGGKQKNLVALFFAALGFGVETADRLKRLAEHIEPHRASIAGWKQVNNPAAHGKVARFHYG